VTPEPLGSRLDPCPDILFEAAYSRPLIRGRLAQLSCAMLYRLHQIEVHGVWRGALAWFADGMNRLACGPLRPG